MEYILPNTKNIDKYLMVVLLAARKKTLTKRWMWVDGPSNNTFYLFTQHWENGYVKPVRPCFIKNTIALLDTTLFVWYIHTEI